MSFGNDLKRFEAKTAEKMERAVRKISLDAFSEIILKTPVDTGRLRANWQVAIGSVPDGTLELNDANGTATVSKVTAETARMELGDVVYLANNLPYARRVINDGYSAQAPAGTFDMTVQRFQVIADRVIAQIGRE